MQLNQYLYMQGDVCRLFQMPRGPDSQMDFYSRHGRRRNYFGTSATAHPLFQAVYIVEPHPPGTELVPFVERVAPRPRAVAPEVPRTAAPAPAPEPVAATATLDPDADAIDLYELGAVDCVQTV